MNFHQPQSTKSTTSNAKLTEAQAEQNPIPFQQSEITLAKRAVGDAGKLCSAVTNVLVQYMAGPTGESQQKFHARVRYLLQSAFGIGSGFAGDSPSVNRLRHIITSVPKRLDNATYYRVNSGASQEPGGVIHVASAEPGGVINLKNPFFESNYTNSQRAILLVHEAIHFVQYTSGFAGPRDERFKKIANNYKIPFEEVAYYPYHHQWFFCKLFKVADPSTTVSLPGIKVTPSQSKKKP